MNGFWAILLKEFAHIKRDRTTILFTFLVPALQLTIFGYAIDVTIDDIPTAVLDLDGRQDSRVFTEAMVNTHTFKITQRVLDLESLRHAPARVAADNLQLRAADLNAHQVFHHAADSTRRAGRFSSMSMARDRP